MWIEKKEKRRCKIANKMGQIKTMIRRPIRRARLCRCLLAEFRKHSLKYLKLIEIDIITTNYMEFFLHIDHPHVEELKSNHIMRQRWNKTTLILLGNNETTYRIMKIFFCPFYYEMEVKMSYSVTFLDNNEINHFF